ncbi:MAG TPA: hypothetical protein VME41_10365 [Stellaceae bacterium]|nr:hypothetical protein [Stellaceae bacterium]
MKKIPLLIAAAVMLLGGAAASHAGPATGDAGGAASPGQLPALGAPDPSGAAAGAGDAGPSFGGQAPQGAGFTTTAPDQVLGADDPSVLSGGGKRK